MHVSKFKDYNHLIYYISSGGFELDGFMFIIISFLLIFVLVIAFVQVNADRKFARPILLVMPLFSTEYYNSFDMRRFSFTLIFINASVSILRMRHYARRAMYLLQQQSNCHCGCYWDSMLPVNNNTLKTFLALLIFFLIHLHKFIIRSHQNILYFKLYINLCIIRTCLITNTRCFVLFGSNGVPFIDANTFVLRLDFVIITSLCYNGLVNKFLLYIVVIEIRFTSNKVVRGLVLVISQLSCNINVTYLEFSYNIVLIFHIGFSIYEKHFLIHFQWLH